jgi:hypothetical protein
MANAPSSCPPSPAAARVQGILRGMHDAALPLYATIACSVLNIALAPPLIFQPLLMGVRGSALATALAQMLPVVALFVALRRWYGLEMSLRRVNWRNLATMFRPTGAARGGAARPGAARGGGGVVGGVGARTRPRLSVGGGRGGEGRGGERACLVGAGL